MSHYNFLEFSHWVWVIPTDWHTKCSNAFYRLRTFYGRYELEQLDRWTSAKITRRTNDLNFSSSFQPFNLFNFWTNSLPTSWHLLVPKVFLNPSLSSPFEDTFGFKNRKFFEKVLPPIQANFWPIGRRQLLSPRGSQLILSPSRHLNVQRFGGSWLGSLNVIPATSVCFHNDIVSLRFLFIWIKFACIIVAD